VTTKLATPGLPAYWSTLPLIPQPLIRPGSLPRKLLGALPELRLKKDVAGTLNWSQKPREVLLLRFHQRNALLLQA
jgi:hypothetical protein